MKNILKNFLLALFSVIISLYLAEIILVIIAPSAEKNLTNILEIQQIRNASLAAAELLQSCPCTNFVLEIDPAR